MIFQLSHANEKDDGDGYTIKHAFIRASSLQCAHVFVTRFGYRISPEYYSDMDDPVELDEHYVDTTVNHRSLEQFESSNEECSQGEHFWHALKIAASNGTPIQLDGQLLFKVVIQSHVPCLHQYEADPSTYNYYRTEINSDVYQFQAQDAMQVLQYLRENSDRFKLADCFKTLPDTVDWQAIARIMDQRIRCLDSNHTHEVFTRIDCEQLSSPLLLIDSEM